jgi:NAD-dependent SIR2 family protein deacetylase
MHTIDIDHAEEKMEVQLEQVQKAHGGPQAISCVDTNLALDQGKPWCITPNHWLLFWTNIFMLEMIVH